MGTAVIPSSFDIMLTQRVDSAVMALSMDELNEQGLIGTEAGSIYYVNFVDTIEPIKLVSSNNMN